MSATIQILQVEDSPEDTVAIQRYLKQSSLDYKLYSASTAEAARDLITRHPFDCILLDLNMPDYDGIEMLRLIRSTIPQPVAVLIVTGSGSEKTAVDAMKSGADDYVVKDELSPLRLQTAISQAMDKVQLRAAVERQNLELAAYAAELKRSNESLQRFAYIASHDMRAPLRMISSYLQLLENRYGETLEDGAREFIGFAARGARQLNQLLEELLRYSQVTNNELKIEAIDTDSLVATVLRDLALNIAEAGAVIQAEPLPPVQGDKTLLWQLFQNLLNNAIKFRRTDTPIIAIRSETGDGQIVFQVQDNGIGIRAEHFNDIFIMFKRLNRQNEFEGTGIGLAICKSIVEKHGGKIWFDSVYGKGTTFCFSLPIDPISIPYPAPAE